MGAFVQPEGVHVLEAEPHSEVRFEHIALARGVQANGAVATALHPEPMNRGVLLQTRVVTDASDVIVAHVDIVNNQGVVFACGIGLDVERVAALAEGDLVGSSSVDEGVVALAKICTEINFSIGNMISAWASKH